MKLLHIEAGKSAPSSLMEEAQHDRIVVEQNGHPVGVILSLEDYDGTLDTPSDLEISELFASSELQAKLHRAEAAYSAGEYLSHEEVGERLRARIGADG